MKYVMEPSMQMQGNEDLPVIRMEIDYELLTLNDALKANDKAQITQSKEKLEQLRHRLLEIQHQ